MYLSIAFFEFLALEKSAFCPVPYITQFIGRVGWVCACPLGYTLPKRAETWKPGQPASRSRRQQRRRPAPILSADHERATRARLRPMHTAADTPRPDQQTDTQTADHRRRTETQRRPRQAPTLANCTPRQQTRPERPETRRNEKRNAYIMKKRRKTAESRNFRKKYKFSSIFIEKTLDNNINSCYHVIEAKEHTTPTHRRRKAT